MQCHYEDTHCLQQVVSHVCGVVHVKPEDEEQDDVSLVNKKLIFNYRSILLPVLVHCEVIPGAPEHEKQQ